MNIFDALQRVRKDGLALRELPDFQNHPDVAQAAVSNNGLALQYVGPDLVQNTAHITRVALAALRQTADAWQFVPERLKKALGFAAQAFVANEQIAIPPDPILENHLSLPSFWEEVYRNAPNKPWLADRMPPTFSTPDNVLHFVRPPPSADLCLQQAIDNQKRRFFFLPKATRKNETILAHLVRRKALLDNHPDVRNYTEGPVWEARLFQNPKLIEEKLGNSSAENLQNLVLKSPRAIAHVPCNLTDFWTAEFLIRFVNEHPQHFQSIPVEIRISSLSDAIIQQAVSSEPKNILYIPQNKFSEELICKGLTAKSPLWKYLAPDWNLTEEHAEIAMKAHGANWIDLPPKFKTKELAIIGLQGSTPAWEKYSENGLGSHTEYLFTYLSPPLQNEPDILLIAAQNWHDLPKKLPILFKDEDLKSAFQNALKKVPKDSSQTNVPQQRPSRENDPSYQKEAAALLAVFGILPPPPRDPKT